MPPPAGLGLSVMVSGRIASGKTSLAKRLSDRMTIRCVSFGSVVQGMLPGTRSPTRGRLQDHGQHIMDAYGAGWLLLRALESHGIPLGCGARVIFDGVRHASMVDEIRSVSRASCVLFVDARPDVRLARYKSRGRDRAKAFRKADGHRVEAELGSIRREADFVIENSDSGLSTACARAEEILTVCESVACGGREATGAGSREQARRGPSRAEAEAEAEAGLPAPAFPSRPGLATLPRAAERA